MPLQRPKPNPLRLDPTRLSGQRRRLRAEFNRRLDRLRTDLRGYLASPILFMSPVDHLEAFSRWLDRSLSQHLLTGQWWASHVRDAFIRGAGRTYDEVRKAALRDPATHAGGKAEFLRSLLAFRLSWGGTPIVVANALGPGERLRLLAIRLGEAVKALAGQLASRLVRAVATLLSAEPRPDVLMRAVGMELAAAGPRVASIVASELTAAHASGQLAGMAALGIVEVEATVEWVRFAGACPRCRQMAGRRFTLAEAEGMIPAHVGCKCVWRAIQE